MHVMVFNCLWNNFGQGWVCMLGWRGNDWMWKNRPQSFHAEFPCIWGSSETINLMNKSGFRFLGTSRLGKGFPFWFSDFNYSSVKPNTANILCCPWQITHMRRIFHCQLGALAPKNCLHLVGLVPDIKPSWRITGALTIKQNNTSTWICLEEYEHMVSRNLIVYHGFGSFSLLKCSISRVKPIFEKRPTFIKATFQHQEKPKNVSTQGAVSFGAFVKQVKIKLAPTVEPVEADGVVLWWNMADASGKQNLRDAVVAVRQTAG